MAGNKHKRRPRQDAIDSAIRPDTAHDWVKDDEELDLEEALFGTSKKRKVAGAGAGTGVGDDDDDSMGEVDDEDLFTVDAPLAAQFQVDLNGAIDDHANLESDEGEDSDSDSDGESSSGSSGSGAEFRAFSPILSHDEDGDEDVVEGTNQPSIIVPDDVVDIDINTLNANARKGKSRQAVWNDPADDLVGVDLGENRRLRKLDRKAVTSGQGEVVDGRVLQERLREQFERLHPPPAWAKQRSINGTPSLSSLLSSTKSFIAPSTSSSTGTGRRSALPQGTIELQRVRNANQQNPTTGKREAAGAGGGVVDFAWHPAKSVGVMAVAGGDRRVRFFNIDGHTNPTLMTLHIPSLPLTRSTFHPSGSSLLLVGPRPFYYTYDLTSQKCIRSPRNLFGSKETPSSPNSLTRHAFSPDGSLLAVAGRRGAVSILDWSSGSAGGVVAELRSGRGGTVSDLIWSGNNQKQLSVLGGRDGAEVEVWDVGQRQVITKWKDDRAFGGTMLKQSQDSTYTAIGSTTGIVNLYSSSSLSTSNSSSSTKSKSKSLIEHSAETIKSLEHLTTPINSISFHPSSEILVAASGSKKDALKMYHLPSCTAFANWPTPTTPLGRITSTAFSSSGEYLAVGNQRGTVLLWSLRHYS